jgi:hypothetical protein
MSRSRWPTEAEMRTRVVGVLTGAVTGLTEPAALAALTPRTSSAGSGYASCTPTWPRTRTR